MSIDARRSSGTLGIGALAALLLATAVASATSPPLAPRVSPGAAVGGEQPESGRFLIATPQVRGSIFERSVIFLVDVGDEGALGLIVNRPTTISLAELLPSIGESAGHIHIGGPVAPHDLMLLLRAESTPPDARRVSEDVYFSLSEDTLRALAEEPVSAERLRVYLGYSGWDRGQLESEIARGDWLVAAEPTKRIFQEPVSELWEKLHRAHSGILVRRTPPFSRPDVAVSH